MMKVFKATFLLIVAIVMSTAIATAEESVFKTDDNQELSATLTFEVKPLKTMTELPFTLTVGGASKISIQSAACDLTMPAMPMPENRPDLTCSGNSCAGKAIFTMAGRWQATFGLIMKDGAHSSIVFDIPMVKMK